MMNNNIVSPTDLQLNDETVIQIKRVSKATTGGRRMRFNCIVVVGDADFASNQFFSSTSGGEFFLGSTGWLTMEGDLISIRPIDPRSRSLRNITAGEQIMIQLVAVFLIPFLISIVGFAVWWKRR